MSTETPVAVAKCQFYNCNELYPVPKDDRNPSPEVTPPVSIIFPCISRHWLNNST